MTLPTYVNKFKELAQKANIGNELAFHTFAKGLTPDEFEKGMLMNPQNMQDWYSICIRLDNMRTWAAIYHVGSNNHHHTSHSSEWDMQVDHVSTDPVEGILIAMMTDEQRKKHIEQGLCFICHKPGHMSGECDMRKKNFKKGKGKGKFKKGKNGRFHHSRHIQAASYDDDEASGSDEDVQESNSDVIKNI